MALGIRVASPSEAEVVSRILAEAVLWTRANHEPLWELHQVSADQVAPDCAAGFFFLAWSDREALGTVRLTDSDPFFWPDAAAGEAIYLHRLAVRRSGAGGAVSSALLQYAVQLARERGAAFVRLDAESRRSRLRGVYERFGFAFHSYRTVRGVHVARYQLGAGDPEP